MREINYYKMREASSIQAGLDALPVAEKLNISSENGESIPNFCSIRVVEPFKNRIHYVACPTKKYVLVQHKEAFQPIIEGLTLAGTKDFKYILWSTPKRASMQIYTAGEGYDTVNIGISVANSVDSESCLRYGFAMHKQKKYFELVGYRQVCSNGMKVRVPLENAEFVREEEKLKIEELMSHNFEFIHTGDIKVKVEMMQYITEALAILRKPVERMIKAAQEIKLTDFDRLKELVKIHVGNRYKSRVMEQMGNENADLWGLYNAITYVASHDDTLKASSRETLLNKAADMILLEV